MFSALTADSTPADIPEALTRVVAPFEHQKRAVHAMRMLEASRLPGREIALDSLMTTNDNRSIETSIGILSDLPGSGKSYTMLAHLLTSPDPPVPPMSHAAYLRGLLTYKVQALANVNCINTNLLVVTRGTIKQWQGYLETMFAAPPEFTTIIKSCIKKQDEIDRVLTGHYRLVVTDESGLKNLGKDGRFFTARFKRFVMDEADSVHLPGFRLPHATFYWLITATPSTLVMRQSATVDLRSLFALSSMHEVRLIQVASDPAFVQASLQLPDVVQHTIRVRRNSINTVLRDLVPEQVMTAIEANDFRSAVALLGADAVTDEEHLVSAVISRYKREVEELEKRYAEAPVNLLDSLQKRIVETNAKIASIAERIRSTECCPIGLCDLTPDTIRAVVPCCQNVFLFENLMTALKRTQKCPICRTDIVPRNLVVINPKGGASTPTPPPATSVEDTVYTSGSGAFQAIVDTILARKRDARMLVFSEYEMYRYTSILAQRGITNKVIQGSTDHINSTLRKFASGEVQVLMMNASHFGAGINLQMADHIIVLHRMDPGKYTQLVGRGQRPGRAGPLTVWNLTHE
jgi:hypothetical protein